MYSELIFSVSGLNTLSVRVRFVSVSGLHPVRVVSLSGLCACPGLSVRVVSCPSNVLSGLCPVQVTSLSGLCLSGLCLSGLCLSRLYLSGLRPVRVVSVRVVVQVVSVRVASCPVCICPGCVLAPPNSTQLHQSICSLGNKKALVSLAAMSRARNDNVRTMSVRSHFV